MCGLAGRAMPATSMRRRRITRTPRSESAAARVGEERLREEAPRLARARASPSERRAGGRGNRHDAPFAALAAHAQLAAVGVPVAHPQRGELAHAQPGAVEELEQRAVAQPRARGARAGRRPRPALSQSSRRERRRQAPLSLGPGQTLGRIAPRARRSSRGSGRTRAAPRAGERCGSTPCARGGSSPRYERTASDSTRRARPRARTRGARPAARASPQIRAQRVRRERALGRRGSARTRRSALACRPGSWRLTA